MSGFQRIQYRRDASARWVMVNPVLASGEPGYETDTGRFKVGDGVTPWKELRYQADSGLQGPVGPAGPVGSIGLRGEQGPKGDQGPVGAAGPASALAIGTVATGSTPSASVSGTAPSQVLNLVLPKGDTGPAGQPCSLTVGTVAAGANPAAVITGTAPAQVLNLVLPKGDRGDGGPQGERGIQGIQGTKGDKGDPGSGVVVQGVVSVWPPAASPADGDLWIMGTPVPAGSPAGSVAGDGFVWDAAASKWINVGQVRGPKGDKGDIGPEGPQGPVGPATRLDVGSVASSTGPAQVTITGTPPNQTLSFVLQKGDKGDTGAQGPQGNQGVQGIPGPANSLVVGTVAAGNPGTQPVVAITGNSPTQTISFTIPKGDTGAAGLSGTYISEVVEVKDGLVLQPSHSGKLLWFTQKAAAPATSNNIGIPIETHNALPVGSQVTIIHDIPGDNVNVSITSGAPLTFQIGWLGEDLTGTSPKAALITRRYSSVRLYKASTSRWLVVGDVTVPVIQFQTQPANTEVTEGTQVTLTAIANATDLPVFYQWQVSTDVGVTWTDISGATGTRLIFTPVLADHLKRYRCRARTGLGGPEFSVAALLRVLAKPLALGRNWKTPAGSDALGGVGFGNGLFVGRTGRWSADGKTWAPLTAGGPIRCATRPVFYNGNWMADFDNETGNWFVSLDGKSWNTTTKPTQLTGAFASQLVFVGGAMNGQPQWYAFGYASNNTAGTSSLWRPQSNDSLALWTLVSGWCPDATPGISDAVYFQGAFYASGVQDGGGVYRSTTMPWTKVTNLRPARMAASPSRLVGINANAGTSVVFDGTTWQTGTMPIAPWSAITFGNNTFVAVAAGTSAVATSTDGLAWNTYSLPASSSWNSVAFGNGIFVAASPFATAYCED